MKGLEYFERDRRIATRSAESDDHTHTVGLSHDIDVVHSTSKILSLQDNQAFC